MRMSITAAILAAASVSAQNTGKLGDAAVVSDNPVGAVYKASMPETAFTKSAYPNGGNVKGDVYALSSPDGTGVIFKVKLSGLPSEGGPFIYHLHDQPVPEDGNCTSTLAHLDPYERGELTPCDANAPQTCQVGDLSGKHGNITGDIDATYTDNFASLKEGIGAFFGNRSIVVHFGNKTRITCANFERVEAGNTCGGGGSPSSTTSSSSSSATGSRPTGATTTASSPIGSNATATGSSPSATTSFVQAAGNANAPTVMLAAGAAALAFFL